MALHVYDMRRNADCAPRPGGRRDEWYRANEEYQEYQEAQQIEAALHRAAQTLADDPDAAWLLDGALRRLIGLWFRRRGLEAPAPERALAAIGQLDAAMALRVRLALRAPNAEARLVACRRLLGTIGVMGPMGDDGAAGESHAALLSLPQWEGR
jgi:hypothetical protein